MDEINDEEFYFALKNAIYHPFIMDSRANTEAQTELLFKLDQIVFEWLMNGGSKS